MNSKSLSVGLVTWNSAKYLPACLESLKTQNYPFYLVVVDNGSIDGSVQLVKNYFSEATIIQNSENKGFCGGHNQAIHASTDEYYLALNPDIELEHDFLQNLVEGLDQDIQAGMASAKLYLIEDGEKTKILDTTGLFIDQKRQQHLHGHKQADHGEYGTVKEVFGVDGSAPLFRRKMLEDIQIDGEYFDESFFAHKEDVDLVWRARLLGWRCLIVPSAVGYHHRSFRPGKRSHLSGEIRLHAVKNRYLLLLKNEIGASFKRDWPQILWYDFKILVYLILFERSSLGSFHIICKLWGRTMRWRREIALRRRVPDKEVLSWFIQDR